jgi:hypothetical protein
MDWAAISLAGAVGSGLCFAVGWVALLADGAPEHRTPYVVALGASGLLIGALLYLGARVTGLA